jgi:urease accessory protein
MNASLFPLRAGLATLALLAAQAAFAHTQTGVAGGFQSGFLHPILGADHMLAMIAVGLWGAQLGAPLLWLLPIAFPAMMAMGALLGIVGMPLPLVEVGIALSALGLGLAVLLRWRAPVPLAIAAVAFFALFHGHAHGVELPEAANALAYGIGFVLCTGLLHLAGIGIGLLEFHSIGKRIVQTGGAGIAGAGVLFLLGVV